MVKNCATCKHHLGAGACRVNLESECGAGEFEAWESAEVGGRARPAGDARTGMWGATGDARGTPGGKRSATGPARRRGWSGWPTR